MLDTKTVNSLRSLGEDFLCELISIYLRDVPGMLSQMEAAILDGDNKSGSMAAHSLKGSSYSLGIRSVGDICDTLEDDFDEGVLENVTEKMQQLKNEQLQAEAELKHLQKQLMRFMQVQPKEI